MSKKKKSSTSIKIDSELWKKVKIEAIKRDLKISELVEIALRKEIGEGNSKSGGLADNG